MSGQDQFSPAQGEFVFDFDTESPPIPPPLPTKSPRRQTLVDERQIKLKSNISPMISKIQVPTPGKHRDNHPAPTGPYFIYGTLMDPDILTGILKLETTPSLRTAKVLGYSKRLWGQYPALIEGEANEVVFGMVFEVAEQRHADRLAEYETKAYRASPCKIQFTDTLSNEDTNGYCFVYDGDPAELSAGNFDLQVWLHRMGRTKIPVQQNC